MPETLMTNTLLCSGLTTHQAQFFQSLYAPELHLGQTFEFCLFQSVHVEQAPIGWLKVDTDMMKVSKAKAFVSIHVIHVGGPKTGTLSQLEASIELLRQDLASMG